MSEMLDYNKKFDAFQSQTLYPKLTSEQQESVRSIALNHRLSFQEFRQIVEASRDLAMWEEGTLSEWWTKQNLSTGLEGKQLKKHLLRNLQTHLKELKSKLKIYPEKGLPKPAGREKYNMTTEASDKKIWGMCPVASEETVCCNLRTIDAVENCAFGCSYCTIQTFYSDEFIFDAGFAEKLNAIDLEPDRFYHFGTGQSSDALLWGNRNGNLDALCKFAADNPNILLEFKTKSNNVRYFLENDVPPNIVCSWSLNPPTIIQNEEHFTANLEQRLEAARRVADRGIKVSFHFHPMIYYNDWERDYSEIAARLTTDFLPEEVLFVSFGSITMIKPAMKKIRNLGNSTKILQMEMVPDPHGKFTYPDKIKIDMFSRMYDAFKPWREGVFFYLCMEKGSIWQRSFGFVYRTNEEFEKEFGKKTKCKLAA